jgi:hypothetical protein
MRCTVVLDTEQPDDEDGRKLLAWWLRLLAIGHDKFIKLNVKEGDIRDENGVAVGHWKIDP